jgi:hypothetical protein
MRKRFGVLVVAALTTTCLVASPSASAATEVGDNCVANELAETTVLGLFEVNNPFSPFPGASPSAGVITKWTTTSAIPAPFALPHVMKVVRPLGPTAVQILSESPAGGVLPGANSFDVRIPIQAGDHIGLVPANEFGLLVCEAPGQPGIVGLFEGAGTPGTTVAAAQGSAPIRVPVSATVEPDADNDGFGDETQDKCPQSAALQVACPVTVLDSFALPKKGKAVVLIATSQAASVTVTGTAKLPRAKKGKKAGSSAQAKLAKVTKVVQPGTLTRFTLNFPGSLKSALADLPKGKSVTLNLTATAPNLTGPATTDKAKLKLKG